MTITSCLSGVTSGVASTPLSAVPGLIANSYSKHLWNYGSDSWVAKVASSCRLLTLLVAFPVIVLGVLDIVSYGIARTLGIVDDVKASTSDKATGTLPTSEIPVICINGESTSISDSTDSDRESAERFTPTRRNAASSALVTFQPKAFYASDSDGLGLAGADVFSPAASEPSSPTFSHNAPLLEEESIESVGAKLKEGLRRRLAQGAEEVHY